MNPFLRSRRARSILLGFVLSLAAAALGAAQPPANAPAGAAPQLASPQFTLVGDAHAPFSWGSYLEVALTGPVNPAWLNEDKWTVKLNGVPVRVARVYAGEPPDKLRFALLRPTNSTGASTFDGLAIEALTKTRFGISRANLTLAFDGTPLSPTGDGRGFVQFELIGRYRLWCFGALLVLLVAGLWFTIRRTGVVRDTNAALPIEERPFSLAKVQLAVWMTIIGASFILLYLFTGQFAGLLNGTALALLGISALTTMASAAVENPPPPAPQKHKDFVTDLVSDAKGANLHRLQMVMWTLVLAVIYVWEMWTNLKLPDFDGQTFGLMGISASTYVWFKKNE
jgi:hypothetical protein